MNRCQHLIRRIEFMQPHIRSKEFLRFLDQTKNVLQADEIEITDLISRLNIIERQFHGLVPPLPDSDITLNNAEENSDEDDSED
jgi:hypothetical protein